MKKREQNCVAFEYTYIRNLSFLFCLNKNEVTVNEMEVKNSRKEIFHAL